MSRALAAEVIREATGCTKDEARKAVDAVLAEVEGELRKGGRFSFTGFGTFRVARTGPRKGRNPRTGEPVEVPSRNVVRFKASPALNKRI